MSDKNEELFQLLGIFAEQSENGEYGLAATNFTNQPAQKVLKDIRILHRSGLIDEKNVFFGDGSEDIYAINDAGYRMYKALVHQGKKSLDWSDINAQVGSFKYGDVSITNSGQMSANFGQGGSHQTINGIDSDKVKVEYEALKPLLEEIRGSLKEIPDEDDKDDAAAEIDKLEKAAKEGKVERFIKVGSGVMDLAGKVADVAPKFAAAVALLAQATGLA